MDVYVCRFGVCLSLLALMVCVYACIGFVHRVCTGYKYRFIFVANKRIFKFKNRRFVFEKKKEIFFLAFHFQLIFALFLHFFYLPIDVAAVAIIYPPLQYYNCYSEQPIYRVFLGLFC